MRCGGELRVRCAVVGGMIYSSSSSNGRQRDRARTVPQTRESNSARIPNARTGSLK